MPPYTLYNPALSTASVITPAPVIGGPAIPRTVTVLDPQFSTAPNLLDEMPTGQALRQRIGNLMGVTPYQQPLTAPSATLATPSAAPRAIPRVGVSVAGDGGLSTFLGRAGAQTGTGAVRTAAGSLPVGQAGLNSLAAIGDATRGQRFRAFLNRPLTGPTGHLPQVSLGGARQIGARALRGAGPAFGYAALGGVLKQAPGQTGEVGSTIEILGPLGATGGALTGTGAAATGGAAIAGGLLGEGFVNVAPDWKFGEIELGGRKFNVGWSGDRSLSNVFKNVGDMLFGGKKDGEDNKSDAVKLMESANKRAQNIDTLMDKAGVDPETRKTLKQQLSVGVEQVNRIEDGEERAAAHDALVTQIEDAIAQYPVMVQQGLIQPPPTPDEQLAMQAFIGAMMQPYADQLQQSGQLQAQLANEAASSTGGAVANLLRQQGANAQNYSNQLAGIFMAQAQAIPLMMEMERRKAMQAQAQQQAFASGGGGGDDFATILSQLQLQE